MFAVPVMVAPVRVSFPPVTCTAPAVTELPLTTGAPAVTVIEASDRAVRSFVVDGPAKTRSSPLFGAVPPSQFAALLQRALPPAPVQVRVAPAAVSGMRDRMTNSGRRVAVFMMAHAGCQRRAAGEAEGA